MEKLERFFCRDAGNVLAFVAVGTMVILLAASLSIDIGSAVTARNQLQVGVDAAALAGGHGLLSNQSYARELALFFATRNTVHGQPIGLSAGDVTFPNSSRIRVVGHFNAPPFFIRLAGVANIPIQAEAEAELTSVVGTTGLRPFFIPEGEWPLGKPVILKIGDPSLTKDLSTPGFFFPVDYPPVNRGNPISGASEYENNIANGTNSTVYINDILRIEPGNMVGPTKAGISEVLSQDPDAIWDVNTNTVINSQFPGATSLRIVKVPFFNGQLDLSTAGKELPVEGLAAFFIEGLSGRDVYGRFMNMVTQGETGDGNTMLYKPTLAM